jgi:hypothetical protein
LENKRRRNVPGFTCTITGDIKDFAQVDNAYASFKREATKLLSRAAIKVIVEYSETIGQGETPK